MYPPAIAVRNINFKIYIVNMFRFRGGFNFLLKIKGQVRARASTTASPYVDSHAAYFISVFSLELCL